MLDEVKNLKVQTVYDFITINKQICFKHFNSNFIINLAETNLKEIPLHWCYNVEL